MSINACTINCSQIDDLCGFRRAAVIGALPPFVPTVYGGGQQQKVNPNYDNLGIFRRTPDNEEPENIVDVSTLEQPVIAVSVELGGQTYTHSMDRGDDLFRPLINVFDIDVASAKQLSESVNITDIKLRVFQ